MSSPWLVIDGDYIAHRAFYTTGGLEYGGNPTGVVYGFLMAVKNLTQQFQTVNVAFAFDGGKSLRRQACPTYKESRRELSLDKQEQRRQLKQQIRQIREEVLPDSGYRNVFIQVGYEGDDVIAVLAKELLTRDKVVIVSADRDLYQLLEGDRVVQYNPRSKVTYTERDLAKEFYGLAPQQWHVVKAIAGCDGDDVKGIKSVGEGTAAKYLRGQLKESHKTYKLIEENIDGLVKGNLPLVKLPWPGCGPFKLRTDKVTASRQRAVADAFGIKTMLAGW